MGDHSLQVFSCFCYFVRVPELTTLLVFGEAPWLMSWCTMLSCPINAATWIGVRPDCDVRRQQRGKMNES